MFAPLEHTGAIAKSPASSPRHKRKKHITPLIVGLGLVPSSCLAQATPSNLPTIEVVGKRDEPPMNPIDHTAMGHEVSGERLASKRVISPDTALLLKEVPGISLAQGGGLSSLPVIHGLNDDRNAIEIGGISITSACGNHMNPPLSYIDPSNISKIEVLTALIPVSKGGDSIGGSIIVTPREPIFAPPVPTQVSVTQDNLPILASDNTPVFSGSLSLFYRSNNKNPTIAGTASAATEHFSVNYTGAWTKASNYHAGGGVEVPSTSFAAQNHSATIAYRKEDQFIALRAAYQDIPYQGFVNQRMDMLGNKSLNFDLTYKGGFDWGRAEANAYYQHTRHYMNFLADKNGGIEATSTTGMPMYTSGTDFGYRFKSEILASQIDSIRIGNEFHGQSLNDWWPPVAGSTPSMGSMSMSMSSMMCCETFQNINNGTRDRLGTYVEWERSWTQSWSTLIGIRNDLVWTNTQNVEGYNTMMYGADAARFNASNHARMDINFDVTALVRFAPDAGSLIEAGYTRKTRSPSLYERYTWSTNAMASEMNNWFGDGNGYVGNIALKPEVAHTFSISASWRDAVEGGFEAKVTPYYMHIENYIDVDKLGVLGTGSGQVNLLQFANHDAEIFGVDFSGRARLFRSEDAGTLTLTGVASYTRGRRLDDSGSLYHMMPMNGKVAIEHQIPLLGGVLTTALEGEAVAAKTNVQTLRLEPQTPAYGLMNVRTAFEFANLRFDAGVENLFDRLYYSPLGGVDIASYKAGLNSVLQTPVAGIGRTIYGGMTIRF